MKRAGDLALRVVASSATGAEASVLLDPAFTGFAGHFPGAPVLPGMCHVDLALRAASQALGSPLELVAVERARFTTKALPGEELRIRLVFGATTGDETSVAAYHSVDGEGAAELHLLVRRSATCPPGAPPRAR